MKVLTTYLLSAAAGMALWTWGVWTSRVHFFHLALLPSGAVLTHLVVRISTYVNRKEKKAMKRAWIWMCLTAGAALALITGGGRLAEGAFLDPDNRPVAR